jgi:hypothetical protein
MTEAQCPRVQAILLVCGVTRQDSFDRRLWCFDSLGRRANSGTPIVICGNKCDLNWAAPPEEAEAFANSKNAPLLLTSSLTGEGIEEVFVAVVKLRLGLALVSPSYTFHVHISFAVELLSHLSAFSDAYLVLGVAGDGACFESKQIACSSRPVWDERLSIPCCLVGNDVVQILIHEKHHSTHDDVIGHGEILVRDIEFGRKVLNAIEPLKVATKREVDRKSRPGIAAALIVEINVQWSNNSGFSECSWSFPFHNASIKFLKATNVVRSSEGFFIGAKLVPTSNSQKRQLRQPNRRPHRFGQKRSISQLGILKLIKSKFSSAQNTRMLEDVLLH